MKLPIISLSLLATPAFAVVSIDYVTVGDAGNAADASGYGAVAYEYNIARNETTVGQYAEFLNATAATDSYGLYSTDMASSTYLGSLITRSGSSGSYTYSVASGRDNLPIAYVSWFDAARFVNWLHNGQGSGSTETGVYNLNGATSGIFTAQPGATVWLPTEDEWYKAAYYDPTKGGTGGYWLHANQSDTMTTNDPTVAGAANYNDGDYVGSGTSSPPSGNALTEVGAYGADSQSYYGTNDQGGNLFEWNDAVISGSSRGLRGGSWGNPEGALRSSNRASGAPAYQYLSLGFRVASVPEPSCLVLTALASGVMLVCRRR